MKFFKNVTMVLMAVIMTICSIPMVAMAAELGEDKPNVLDAAELVGVEYDEDGRRTEVYEIDIAQEAAADGEYGIMPLSLDQSFTMGASHRGADRTYSGTKLQYAVTVTDQYGNAVDNRISVKLYDYNHSFALSNTNVSADGSTTVIPGISIVPGRVYYFQYSRTAGASRTLKVRMRITDYN